MFYMVLCVLELDFFSMIANQYNLWVFSECQGCLMLAISYCSYCI